jgi:hypothetical protein
MTTYCQDESLEVAVEESFEGLGVEERQVEEEGS